MSEDKRKPHEIVYDCLTQAWAFSDLSKRSELKKPGAFIERFLNEEQREKIKSLSAEDLNKTFRIGFIDPPKNIYSRLKQVFDKKILKR